MEYNVAQRKNYVKMARSVYMNLRSAMGSCIVMMGVTKKHQNVHPLQVIKLVMFGLFEFIIIGNYERRYVSVIILHFLVLYKIVTK